MLWDSGVSTFSWQPWSQFHPFCASFPLLKRYIFISPTLFTLRYGTVPWIAPLWVIITTVQLYNGCLKSNLNASNEILGESSESRFNVRNYSIVEAWLQVFGSHQLKLVSKDITEKTEGQNYKHRLWVVEKKGSSFQASHGRESSSPENTRPRFDLCWFILFILYMPRFERRTNKRKQRRGTFPECSQDLYFLLTVLTSPCLQHHLFHFLSALPSPIPTWIFAVVSLFPSPLKNTTPALFSSTCSASLNLLRLRPPPKQSDAIIIDNLFPYLLLFFAFRQATQTILHRLPIRIGPVLCAHCFPTEALCT